MKKLHTLSLSAVLAATFSVSSLAADSAGQYIPNDVDFDKQWSWLAPDGDKVGSNVLRAVQSSNGTYRPRIAVIDGAFEEHDEVNFVDGWSMAAYDSGFASPEFTYAPGEGGCEDTPHGLWVSGIIGSESNNGIGISGIVEADLVGVNVARCASISPSDLAIGILWAAGETIPLPFSEELSEIRGVEAPRTIPAVDVINISIGASRIGGCPVDMQEAVDLARSRGIAITVAAGNSADEASQYWPANCEGVITVGASDEAGQLWVRSSYGDAVDLIAPGDNIYTPSRNGGYSSVGGTSFAAPLVAGVIGLAKSEFPSIMPSEVEMLLKDSAFAPSENADSLANSCEFGKCGAGIMDAHAFLVAVREYMAGGSSYVQHALSDGGSCQDGGAMAYFADQVSLCDMYEIGFNKRATTERNVVYKLHEFNAGEDLVAANSNRIVVSTSNPVVMSSDIDESKQYAYEVCVGGSCEGGFRPMNTDRIASPDSCSN